MDTANLIVGNEEDNNLLGTAQDDHIFGYGGNDTIEGNEGNDTIDGGWGEDSLLGNAGDDIFHSFVRNGYNAGGIIKGGDGIDLLDLDFSEYELGVDNTRFDAFLSIDGKHLVWEYDEVEQFKITGTNFNDYLLGAELDDTLIGGAGDDWLNGNSGNDILDGGEGKDYLRVDAANADWYTEQNIIITNNQVIGDGIDSISNIELAYLFAGFGNDLIDASGVTDIETIIFGNLGNDTIYGGAKDDTISGSTGDDSVDGGAGNDTISGGTGNDSVDGGAGNDTLSIYTNNNDIILTDTQVIGEGTDSIRNIEHATLHVNKNYNIDASSVTQIETYIIGGDYSNLRGGQKDDRIVGGFANDTLIGFAGDDTLDGGAGDDRLYVATDNRITLSDTEVTGDGTDTISSIEFANLYGRAGDNYINARGADEVRAVIRGNDGNDTLRGGENNDTLLGGNGNDVLFGEGGDDVINGNGGSDRLYVVADNDITLTNAQAIGEGTDTIRNIKFANLYGGASDNRIDARVTTRISTVIRGNGGNDNLRGGMKNDTILGGAGNDTLIGYGGNDTINGNSGSDRLYVAVDDDITLNDTQVIGDGIDSISNIEFANLYGRGGDNHIDARGTIQIQTVIKGNGGNDTLRGGMRNDIIQGGEGDDVLIGFEGNDILSGGAGSDRLYVVINNDITLTDTQVTGDGTDTFNSIEFANLYGRAGDNFIDAREANNIQTVIKGYDGNDTLIGSQTSDNIQGGNGSDFLYGEAGDDTLIGNGGKDVFVLESESGTDLIRDFTDGIDSFGLSPSISFNDLGITNNSAETATLIVDLNSNQVLAVVNNVDAGDITAADFIANF